jgi:hypothetical protein
MTEEEKNATPADEEEDSKLPPQKCICLASSRRILTECNCHLVHHELADLSHADPGQPILFSDSACDQSLITKDWTVLKWTGHYVLMTGAFAGRNVDKKLPVVIGASKLRDEDGTVYAAIANEALYDDNEAQVESLLSVHQALADPCNGIDDCASCERDIEGKPRGKPGWQKARFDMSKLSFFFDGLKCFFEVSPITGEELDSLPRVYIHGHSSEEYIRILRTYSQHSAQPEAPSYLLPWKH